MAAACLCPQCGKGLPKDAPQGLCPSCLLRSGLAANGAYAGANGTADHHGPFVPPGIADLARHFPQLEILELIGQGGMGAVYKARQSKLDRLVALKVLPPTMCKDPAFAERFAREARALARLCHPNIVAVHDFGEVEGVFFFLMEYVDGANLRHVLEAGRLTPAEALRIVPQVCEALQYAHEEGIVHRDIKPENILLDQKGRVKVADFGLAKLVGPTPGVFTLTGSRQVVGTPHYMAPEQMEKPHTVDHRADIYSLGVVFYEMLTGELPLGRFAAPSQKAPVDGRLDDVVLRALAKEPEQRFQRVSEVKESLDDVSGANLPATPLRLRPAALSIPFSTWHWGDGTLSSVHGLLRWDGKVLSVDMEIEETKPGFFQKQDAKKAIREIQLPLSDLQSIRLDSFLFRTVVVLRGMRLDTLAEIAGRAKGEVWLYIHRKDRPDAERLIEDTCLLIGRRPVPPSPVPVTPPPQRGYLGQRVQSLVRKARYWMVDSVLLSRASALPEKPVAIAKAPGPPRGRLRGLLANTVGNSVFWGIVLCLVGTATAVMPWSDARLSVSWSTRTEGIPPRPVTVYRTYEGGEIAFPPGLTLQDVYRHVPELRPQSKVGFTYEEGVIIACLFGGMGLFLIGTSTLRSGGLWRTLFLVPGSIAVIVLAFERVQRIGFGRGDVAWPTHNAPRGIPDDEWAQLMDRLLAHWSLEPEFGPFVAIGLAVGLLLLGSWQLRQGFASLMNDAAEQRPA